MVPVGIVAKIVAIKSGLTDIVQTFEILRCGFVLSDLVLILSGKLILTGVCELILTGVCELILTGVCELILTGVCVVTSIAGHCVMTEICVIVTEIMRSVT